ncbi:MAG TPA: sulfotransferase [Gammaproteobacteria bacterium]|nr:sulfotransferase [Gammaproteobacteria bacterium]
MHFRAALACGGTTADEHCQLAAAAGQFGDFVTLRREARAAIAADRRWYTAWYQLSITPDEAAAETMQAMRAAAVEAGADPAAWPLHLALARVLEKAGRYDEAFAAADEANRRRVRALRLDYGDDWRYFANVRRCLGKEFASGALPAPTRGPRPIFIVGMPRSGTTLVEAILGAHPAVTPGGEMQFLHLWLHRNLGAADQSQIPERLATAPPAALLRLARDWREFLDRSCAARAWISDKMPENYALLGLIARCFPEAAIVHVRRDPRDTCVSCFFTALAGRGLPASLAEVGAWYRAYEGLMTHWRDVLGAERIVEVEYERLVSSPEPEIRRLLAAIGLDWHSGCLAYYASPKTVATASLYQVRQPPYRDSIGRWRHFERHLLPLRRALAGEAAS